MLEQFLRFVPKKHINFNFPKVTILFVADTHGTAQSVPWNEPELPDVVITLGDIFPQELFIIKQWTYERNIPIYGVCGNHDSPDALKNAEIIDLHKAVAFIDGGISVAGWGGTIRYKKGDYFMYDKKESWRIGSRMPKADILISHDYYKHKDSNYYKSGQMAISKYLVDNRVPLHFYGHLHDPNINILPNGTRSECIFGFEKVVIEGNTVESTILK